MIAASIQESPRPAGKCVSFGNDDGSAICGLAGDRGSEVNPEESRVCPSASYDEDHIANIISTEAINKIKEAKWIDRGVIIYLKWFFRP
jgi:hypothetical protein